MFEVATRESRRPARTRQTSILHSTGHGAPQHFSDTRTWCRFLPVMRTTSLMALILIALTSAITHAVAAKRQGQPTEAATAAEPPKAATDADAMARIIATYAKSIDGADTSLASEIWWDSPDVSFIHPLGHEHGFDQIKQNVYKRLMGDTFSERKLTPRDITIHVYGDAAWAEFYWDFNAKFRKDGQAITTHGRETQIYRKIQGTWRIIHVHYSGMPATQPGQSF
jgi:ketosteroid isomerase-like protein